MSNRLKFIFVLLGVLEIILLALIFLGGLDVQLLNPKGPIAHQQRDLILHIIALMLVVVLPVYISIFVVAFKFREGSKKARHDPEARHSKKFEAFWWIAPAVIVVVMGFVTWKSTHALDPYKPIKSEAKPLVIRVVALQWRWLFIYPEQNIATVNFIQFPEKTPISFELTADAPMNSFWIPSLGGQMYAMTGMTTKLHLLADSVGDFDGGAAEISGKGFAKMRFVARATSGDEFDRWVKEVKRDPTLLDEETYEELSKPSEDTEVVYYGSVQKDLYNKIVEKFMSHK